MTHTSSLQKHSVIIFFFSFWKHSLHCKRWATTLQFCVYLNVFGVRSDQTDLKTATFDFDCWFQFITFTIFLLNSVRMASHLFICSLRCDILLCYLCDFIRSMIESYFSVFLVFEGIKFEGKKNKYGISVRWRNIDENCEIVHLNEISKRTLPFHFHWHICVHYEFYIRVHTFISVCILKYVMMKTSGRWFLRNTEWFIFIQFSELSRCVCVWP